MKNKQLHEFLDVDYGPTGDDLLREKIENGADVNLVRGPIQETPLHVAARRRRLSAMEILLDNGADIDAKTAGGKTAYAHSIRRRFVEIAEMLETRGADTYLNDADKMAVAVVTGQLVKAKKILEGNPDVIRTGNPEEDRLLADVSGRNDTAPVELLIKLGADLSARGLDDGTALHQAAWFGQPDNARLLIEAGAPLEIFDSVHTSSPIGWAVHGSHHSGGADGRQEEYISVVKQLLDAGAKLSYPNENGDGSYLKRLLNDASDEVRSILEEKG